MTFLFRGTPFEGSYFSLLPLVFTTFLKANSSLFLLWKIEKEILLMNENEWMMIMMIFDIFIFFIFCPRETPLKRYRLPLPPTIHLRRHYHWASCGLSCCLPDEPNLYWSVWQSDWNRIGLETWKHRIGNMETWKIKHGKLLDTKRTVAKQHVKKNKLWGVLYSGVYLLWGVLC